MRTILVLLALAALMATPAMAGCFSPEVTETYYVINTRYHILNDYLVSGGDDFCFNWRYIGYTVPEWQDNVTRLAGGDEALYMQLMNITTDARDGI